MRLTDLRPMLGEDEKQVRELFEHCHPNKYAQPEGWYFAHPTLVACVDTRIVGFTSFTIVVIAGHGPTLYGEDLCVHPEYRRYGIATSLHTARLVIARDVGTRIFMGTAHKDNKAMERILLAAGAHVCVSIGDDILYVGPVGV